MVTGNGNIRIDGQDFLRGIGNSPYVGNGMMVNVDVLSKPGVLMINHALTKESSTTVDALIKYMDIDPISGKCFGIDTNKQVYKRLTNGTWSEIAGNSTNTPLGLGCWKDYLFVATDNGATLKADVYGPISDATPAWTNTWATLTTGSIANVVPVERNIIDDTIMFGTGETISQIDELTSFDPSSGATYDIETDVLTLPDRYEIRHLDVVGDYVTVGTKQTYPPIGDIFRWDRNSAGAEVPVRTGGYGIRLMKSVNGQLFAIVGPKAQLYAASSVDAQKLMSLDGINPNPTNIAVSYDINEYACDTVDGAFVFGLGSTATSTSPVGVFEYKDGALIMRTISTGSDGSSNALQIGAIVTIGEKYIVSWRDNTTFGVDVSVGSNGYRVSSYGAYMESPLHVVGTTIEPKTYQNGEITLAKDLTTGQGVKIKYRSQIEDSWTTLATFDFATHGAVSSYRFAPDFSADKIQVRIELTTGASSTTTPEVQSVELF